MEEERKYCAFISYRHKDLDKSVAKKIHSMIERYTLPSELRGEWGSKKLGKVFRDEEELPVSSNLTDSITAALDNTDYLIVICTPDTPESVWVEREISYFLQKHDRSHLIAVLANGTPEEAFPKLLTTEYDEKGNISARYEPLAANLTGNDHRFKKSRIRKEAVRIYAAIMGCHFDSLWQREKRHELKCALALAAIVAAVAVWYGVSIEIKNQRIETQKAEIEKQYDEISKQNEKIAAQNDEIAAQNREIKEKYEDIQSKNKDLERKEAEALIKEGELLLDKGDIKGAKECVLNAMSKEEGRIAYADEAQYILSRALASCHYDNTMRTTAVALQEDDIADLKLSDDGKALYTLDVRGYVRCFSTEDGSLKWRGDSKSHTVHTYIADRDRMLILPEYGLLLIANQDAIAALSLEDGSYVWDVKFSTALGADFFVMSEDKSRIAVIDSGLGFENIEKKAMLIETSSGEILKEIELDSLFGEHSIISTGRQSGVFLTDGSVVGMVYCNDSWVTYESACIFKLDFDKNKAEMIEKKDAPEDAKTGDIYPFVIGMEYIKESDSCLIFSYDSWEKKFRARQLEVGGKVLKDYEYAMAMPSRTVSGVYRSTYGKTGSTVYVSCGEIAFVYDMSLQKFTDLRTGINGDILCSSCLDAEKGIYTYLTSDGRQFFYAGEGGKTAYVFSDKTVLGVISVSNGYALNENGAYGMQLADDAVEAVATLGDPKKVYILRPDKDDYYKGADIYDDFASSGYLKVSRMEELAGGDILLMGNNEIDSVISILISDPETQEKKEEYKLDVKLSDLPGVNTVLETAVFWPDKKHFSYSLNREPAIFDIEKGEVTKPFTNTDIKAAAYSVLENGDILSAVVGRKKESSILSPEYEIAYTVGGGSVQRVSIPEGKTAAIQEGSGQKFYINAGSNGNIVVSLCDVGGDVADSFMVVSAADGTYRIAEENGYAYSGKVFACGKKNELFVYETKQNKLAIYDVSEGECAGCIDLPFETADIVSAEFLKGDTAFAIWTKSRILYVYDSPCGELMYEGAFENDNSSAVDELKVVAIEDNANDRIFFVTSKKAVMVISTVTWKKTADFRGFDAFSHKTGEIFRVMNSGMVMNEEENSVIKVIAYTLDDLIAKADEQMVKRETDK
jgi:hypothetical protein